MEIMDSKIDDLQKAKCDNEQELRVKTAFIKDLDEEYKTLKQKMKMLEQGDKVASQTIEEIFAKIGRSVDDDYKKESEKRFNKMYEEMKKSIFTD